MDKYIYDENNGLWYELQGDYYLPCLTLPLEEEKPIGIWGQRHKRYLKEHRKATYTTLLTSGKLNDYGGRNHLRIADRRQGVMLCCFSFRAVLGNSMKSLYLGIVKSVCNFFVNFPSEDLTKENTLNTI